MAIIDLDSISFDEEPFANGPNHDLESWSHRVDRMVEANRWSLAFTTDLLSLSSPGGSTTSRMVSTSRVVSTPESGGGGVRRRARASGRGWLPREGPGFVAYSPDENRHGSLTLVNMIKLVALEYSRRFPGDVLWIGDLDAAKGHVSHKSGVDVDIRLPSKVTRKAASSFRDPNYSREKTQVIIDLFMQFEEIEYIFFNDTSIRGHSGQARGAVIQLEPGHDDHIHIRIKG